MYIKKNTFYNIYTIFIDATKKKVNTFYFMVPRSVLPRLRWRVENNNPNKIVPFYFKSKNLLATYPIGSLQKGYFNFTYHLFYIILYTVYIVLQLNLLIHIYIVFILRHSIVMIELFFNEGAKLQYCSE